MGYEYGKPVGGASLGSHHLFSPTGADCEAQWEPTEPDATATLWRYMSFAKLCDLLERRKVFFALVAAMEDSYEGFICPAHPRDSGDRLHAAELIASELLHMIARSALICCWTASEHESALMWKTYAGAEGVAIRTTFHDLKESIRCAAEHPVTFGQVKYVDYPQQEVPRFGWAPLFHKRTVYRGEEEVRAILPGPPWETRIDANLQVIRLDPDVEEQKGRYVPVDLDILVREVLVSPYAEPWFAEVVKSVMKRSAVEASVIPSAIADSPEAAVDLRERRAAVGALVAGLQRSAERQSHVEESLDERHAPGTD